MPALDGAWYWPLLNRCVTIASISEPDLPDSRRCASSKSSGRSERVPSASQHTGNRSPARRLTTHAKALPPFLAIAYPLLSRTRDRRFVPEMLRRRAQRQLDLERARQQRILRRVREACAVAAGGLRGACRRQRGHQDDRRPDHMCATHVALLRPPATAGGSETQKLVDLHHEAAVLQRRHVGNRCVAALGVDDEELAAGHVFPAEAHVRG